MTASQAEVVDATTIEIIFARLLARYGSAWRNKWAGVDPEVVAKDWFHVLGHLTPHALDFGLEHLPVDFVPTAHQFREVCNRAPAREVRQLPAPRSHPSRAVADALMATKTIAQGRRNLRSWAHALRDSELNHGGVHNGRVMTLAQRQMWRAGLVAPEVAGREGP